MILLIGGTSETAGHAARLAAEGFRVLVSTATEIPLPIGDHECIRHRGGALDVRSMRSLIRSEGIEAIVDAAHPYAQAVHETAHRAAALAGVPCLRWERPEAVPPDAAVHRVSSHRDAAREAFAFSGPVLLTTGSRTLAPYADESHRTGLPLIVRVLDHAESVRACVDAGVQPHNVVTGKGPFTEADNVALIEQFGVRSLVMKDSGVAGGTPAKLAAAQRTGCALVLLARPRVSSQDVYRDFAGLVASLKQRFTGTDSQSIADRQGRPPCLPG